jgi:hypothetical protein
MLRILKQSTAATLLLGPFLDETDGKTAETALTISQADVLLWKQGGTTLAQKNEATSLTHRSNGLYTCPIDTTDTNTLGILTVSVHESGALPIRQDYAVVPANVFDSFASTDLLFADVKELNSATAGAINLALSAGVGMLVGTVDNTAHTPTTTEFECDDITEATADHFNGRIIVWTSGALIREVRRIDDYAIASGRGHFTVTAMTEAPANNDTLIIV